MCDSITNGGPISFASSGGGSCPPANVIIASNVLSTSGNIYAQDGTFTGNLYVSGKIIGLVTVTGNTLSNLNASNLAFGVVDSSLIYGNTLSNIQASNISGLVTVTGNTLSNLNASNLAFGIVKGSLIYGNTLSNLNASNLAFGVVNSALIYGNTLSNIQASNISGLTGNTLSNLNASNLAFGVVNSALIYGNTLSNIQASNISGLTGNTLSNLNASNLAFGVVNSALIYGNTLSNIQASNIVQPFSNLSISNITTDKTFQSNLTVASGGVLATDTPFSAIYLKGGLLNFSNSTFYVAKTVIDNPYTSAVSSDGSTRVFLYNQQNRIDIYTNIDYPDATFSPDGPVSASLNGNGNVLAVGGGENVYIYVKNNTTWSLRDTIEFFGYSVSLSYDGNTLLVSSATQSTGSVGDTMKYTYDGVNWNGTTITLPGTDLCSSVAVSGDGQTYVFGCPFDSTYSNPGSVNITKDLVTYHTVSGDNPGDYFGAHVSVNYNGTRIVANSSFAGGGNYIKIIDYTN